MRAEEDWKGKCWQIKDWMCCEGKLQQEGRKWKPFSCGRRLGENSYDGSQTYYCRYIMNRKFHICFKLRVKFTEWKNHLSDYKKKMQKWLKNLQKKQNMLLNIILTSTATTITIKKCTYYYQYENPLVVPYSYLVLLLLHHSLQMAKDSPWVVLKQWHGIMGWGYSPGLIKKANQCYRSNHTKK